MAGLRSRPRGGAGKPKPAGLDDHLRRTRGGGPWRADAPGLPPGYDVKFIGAYERKSFKFADFTDLRSGQPYAYSANVLQLTVQATF